MVVLRLGSNMGKSSGKKSNGREKHGRVRAVSGPCQGRAKAVSGPCPDVRAVSGTGGKGSEQEIKGR